MAHFGHIYPRKPYQRHRAAPLPATITTLQHHATAQEPLLPIIVTGFTGSLPTETFPFLVLWERSWPNPSRSATTLRSDISCAAFEDISKPEQSCLAPEDIAGSDDAGSSGSKTDCSSAASTSPGSHVSPQLAQRSFFALPSRTSGTSKTA